MDSVSRIRSDQVRALAGTFFGLTESQPDAVLLRGPDHQISRRELAELAQGLVARLHRDSPPRPGLVVNDRLALVDYRLTVAIAVGERLAG